MKKITIAAFLIILKGVAFADPVSVTSPDGQIKIEFAADHLRPNTDAPAYQVFYHGKTFLNPSLMGFEIPGQATFISAFKLVSSKIIEHRGSWKPLYGERSEYPDNYNEITIQLKEQLPPGRDLVITFRAYNEGIAFKYDFPNQPSFKKLTITREITEFAFSEGTYVWEEHGHEGLYAKAAASAIQPSTELPLTVKTANGIYGCIAEAGNSDYPRAYINPGHVVGGRRGTGGPGSNQSNTLSISLRGEAKGETPYATAWRMITLSDRPGGLLEQNYLLLNLNKPQELRGDLSWIKPGKAIRDPAESTISTKKFIDYSAAHGINYVIIDWGWYGPPNSEASDPSMVNVVNVSTGKPIPGHTGLDIPEVVAYGKSKGVGIWLYVNRQGLERYMDKAFAQYEKWGVKGIKPGFINVGNQEWQQWVEDMVRKAAKYHLMVDSHDAFRPTGYTRTYPNWLTQEGVMGNEHTPNADHNTMLPFTRYTIGAADYTPGYCRTALQNTWAHKLALPILYYSPATFLFWGEQLSDCHERPELALWKDVATTWDDTKVLSGEIGEYAVIARQTGKKWFVGGITNHEARNLDVNLSFLTPGKTYTATIYTDDAKAEQVIITNKKVRNTDHLTMPLLASGGFAMEITEK